MEICWSAKIVLVISILAILFDIFFFGFYVVDLLQSIIFTAIIIFITNWSCYKIGYSYNLITWSILIFYILTKVQFGFSFCAFGFFVLTGISTKNPNAQKEKLNCTFVKI